MTIYSCIILLSQFWTSLLFPCLVLTVATWLTYRFLRRQARWPAIFISVSTFHNLIKCCTQYASKYGKLSNGHRTEKGQFSFKIQRRAMPKYVQTNIQLYSFHILKSYCSKSFKLGFNSTLTKNFQKYKLSLKKVEEPKIKLPTSVGL